MAKLTWLACALLLVAGAAFGQDSEARRREALEVLRGILKPTNRNITGRINLHDKSWAEWLERTGELPPDFEEMPSIPELPGPLVRGGSGAPREISTEEEWTEQRQWIREQFEQWFYGRIPPPPGNTRVRSEDSREEGGVTVRRVVLEFGPGHRGTLRVELIIPPGEGPFPVFLTNHARTRPWVNTAVRRGYIGCIYYATDPGYGHGDDSDAFLEVYPGYDFSVLARWAWAASRAVDYLVTLPEVDAERIGLTGHSRNGKQALLAAALDERIGAVIPSSGNTGEGNPWRYTSDIFRNETIEQITGNFPHWFHPRLRFFVGREHKLPVDQNSLMALVAPRGLMLATAYSETQGNPMGFEQAYHSVGEVYRFLDAEDKLALYIRAGEHATTAGVIEDYVDFFDTVFGLSGAALPEDWTFGYSFDAWRDLTGEEWDARDFPERVAGDFLRRAGGSAAPMTDWPEARESIREQIRWALGDEPPGAPLPARQQLEPTPVVSSAGYMYKVLGRPHRAGGMGHTSLTIGDDLQADLYFPADADGQPARANLPAVIWLHPYAYTTGYSRYTRPVFESLTRRGFAVLAFDQIGFGTRVLDARPFYRRYPGWSLLGKMVTDTRGAIDALAALGEGGVIDVGRIYAVGYALGAKVGLFTAALDERLQALAAIAGFQPLRLDRPGKGAEGIRHYSHLHGLLPRFGFFLGEESRLPVDYDEILAAIAPRRVLVIAPELDRYAPVEDVREAVEAAGRVYDRMGSAEALELRTPRDFNRFERERQEEVFEWLAALE